MTLDQIRPGDVAFSVAVTIHTDKLLSFFCRN
ncbi:uncharacterized protein G2W53_019464 [Senna tora]|uniref:Uncharacterized protein n=1 Tax=Senna tora TaxID=362788 RepID=A0A834TTJ9_9FABA|nr:uncharacterized protein G2W53_019464 [Senna tora]